MSTRATRAPGMLDVARLAGVSHQTVSRVLNHHPSVRPETRERVQQAISTLGYRRNPAARALVTNRSHTIGLLTTASQLSGPVSTMAAVEQASRGSGLWVSVASLPDHHPDTVRAALEHFLDQGVDGIVVIAPVADALSAVRAAGAGVPVVVVAPAQPEVPGISAVAVDQHGGARTVVAHLAGLGHRRIAHLAGPPGWLDADERVAGWRAECAARGLPEGPLLAGDWSAAAGHAAAALLEPGVTAVFAGNDLMAVGLVHGLAERGVRVPEEVSVAGFDDIEVAAYARPPLTTVRQDFAALGDAAVGRLLAVLAGEPGPTALLVPPTLQVRASTAPPPSAAA